ncbi:hypothetical protein L6R53_04430 [Myxococcota bacterium]|nr:hypothetical protein [Myxococcota bacterium]
MFALLAQVAAPPFSFGPMTWAAFLLANAIIMAILGPRLLKDLRGWFAPPRTRGPGKQPPGA